MRIGGGMMMVRGVGAGARQECGGEAFGANLQRESAIPTGHEAARNERAERVREYKEAGKPPTLA
jgi:hypothetical protein